jgi:hypothetical protein
MMEDKKQHIAQPVVFIIIILLSLAGAIFAVFQQRHFSERAVAAKKERLLLEKKLNDIEDQIKNGPRPLPGMDLLLDGPGQVYTYLYESSRNTSMSMRKVVILPESGTPFRRTIPAEVTLAGSYPAMLLFLDKMAQNRLLGSVKKIQIDDTEDDPLHSLTVFIALSIPISGEVRP